MAPYAVVSRPEGEGYLAVTPAAPLAFEYLVHGYRVGACFRQEYLGVAVVAAQPVGVYGMRKHDIGHQWDFGLDEYVKVQRRLFFHARLKRALGVYVPVHDRCRPVHIARRVLGQRLEGSYLARAFSKRSPVGHLFVEFFVIIVGLAEISGLLLGQVGVYDLVQRFAASGKADKKKEQGEQYPGSAAEFMMSWRGRQVCT